MATNNLKAADNPALANSVINQILADSEEAPEKAEITTPSETLVNLPGGYITPKGEVIKTAEVRELTGKDEEYISKVGSIGKAINTILSRATVSIGNTPVDDSMLDTLLSGDRDELMLGIFKATFGTDTVVAAYCNGCDDFKSVSINTDRDIARKILVNPIDDRTFTLKGKGHTYKVALPNGFAQKAISEQTDKTMAELTTLLLEHVVLEIDDHPVVNKAQVQALGVADRRLISTEINNRVPGPKFEDVVIDCPDCNGKVGVPITLGTLFRF